MRLSSSITFSMIMKESFNDNWVVSSSIIAFANNIFLKVYGTPVVLTYSMVCLIVPWSCIYKNKIHF
ncbi:unnamed protein product [Acanthoscelides obtectus]|uniref:Uncharacterized protein n=1 Tax=Acanthoscelides obtectus TaxID=200917 RepID=A0A9P0LR45_ACAOB|nr:unnamed protein product [Acanthoscelides obtectus]CAK1670960.1 hypothetical protein AOBTE_LOCUS27948 [Acanthoscelides obtectus]